MPGLLEAAARRRREALADTALSVYAGTAAALGGAAGLAALDAWMARLRRGDDDEGILL